MKKNIWTCLFILFYSCIFLFAGRLSFLYAESTKVIKLATIAPEGSTWTNVIHDIDKEIQTKSKGTVRLKIYSGGSMGDEDSVIRKMRISQIHCAALTSIGLANILSDIRILDLPFVYKDEEEIDFVKNELYNDFYKAFDEKGYILLGWSELGFVCFFSKKEVKSISDIRSSNVWLWEGDPLAKTLFKFLRISPIALPLPNVTRSLQAGAIDTIYGSPLAVVALSWFRHIKYMLKTPLANATAAILMERKYYDTFPPDLQVILKNSFKSNMIRLSRLVQNDNAESIEAMKANGIKLVSGNDTITNEFKEASIKTHKMLAGSLYSKELLDTVTAKLETYRKSKHLQSSR